MQEQLDQKSVLSLLHDRSLLLIAGTAAILLFIRLNEPPIYILDEARNAQCAKEMMQNSDWITPTFNDELRPHKPPLHYYFMWLGYKLFGTNAFGARFFSALMGLLTILVTYYFTRRFISRRVAILASAILVCSTHFMFEFRLAVPDPYLIFFVTWALFSFYAHVQENKLSWLLTAAIATGLSVLAKGPVAIVLIAAPAICFLILQHKWKLIFSVKMLYAFLLTTAVAFPWFIMVHIATNGAFTRGFFIEHNFNRFSETMEGHGGIFLLIPAFVIIGLLPATVLLPGALKHLRHHIKNPFILYCLLVVSFIILFFSIAKTKLPNYPMPCYAFASIWLGYFINDFIEKKNKFSPIPLLILFIINLVLFVAAVTGIRFEPVLKDMEIFASLFVLLPAAALISNC